MKALFTLTVSALWVKFNHFFIISVSFGNEWCVIPWGLGQTATAQTLFTLCFFGSRLHGDGQHVSSLSFCRLFVRKKFSFSFLLLHILSSYVVAASGSNCSL